MSGADNAALYFPRLLQTDPLSQGQRRVIVPCGAIAGIMARTDAARGVWKAPASLDSTLTDLGGLVHQVDDARHAGLNPLGINCLWTPNDRHVVWGARTISASPEWRYLPVRRLALYIEASIRTGVQGTVFESNDEPLWSTLRQGVGDFLNDLFRQGAFPGPTPSTACFVRCDRTSTTQADIDNGIVVMSVGFAPIRPAEFLLLRIHSPTARHQ